MTERLCQTLVVRTAEVNEAPNMNTEIENENLEKSESLEKDKGKKRANQGRKKEKIELKKSFPVNKSKKLCLNVLSHHLMKVTMKG